MIWGYSHFRKPPNQGWENHGTLRYICFFHAFAKEMSRILGPENAWLEFSLVGMGHFPTFHHPPQNMVLWLNSCSGWVLIPSRYIAGKYLYICGQDGGAARGSVFWLRRASVLCIIYIYIIYTVYILYILWVWIHPPKRQNRCLNLRSTLTSCCFDALLRSKEDDYTP